jgi:hypothetical protein
MIAATKLCVVMPAAVAALCMPVPRGVRHSLLQSAQSFEMDEIAVGASFPRVSIAGSSSLKLLVAVEVSAFLVRRHPLDTATRE